MDHIHSEKLFDGIKTMTRKFSQESRNKGDRDQVTWCSSKEAKRFKEIVLKNKISLKEIVCFTWAIFKKKQNVKILKDDSIFI